MRHIALAVALAAAALPSAPLAAGDESPALEPLLVALEHRAESSNEPADHVTVLDPADLTIVGKAPVAGDFVLTVDRDARHLVTWGTGEISIWTGKYKDPVRLAISDLVDQKVDATFTLFKPPFTGMLDGASGRYFAMRAGDDDEPATFLALDLVARREIGRLSLGTEIDAFDWVVSGDLVFMLVGSHETGRKARASRLVVYDAAAARVIDEATLAPRPLGVYLLGDYVYVVCRGTGPKDDAPKPGTVYVYDASTHALLAERDVGVEPGLVRGDALSATLWVVAQGTGDRAPGLLTELRAHLVRAQAPVAAGVTGFRLADDGETIVLMAENGVAELRRRDLDTVRLYRLSFDPRYVILDGSHRRAFVGAQHGSDIAILDRDKGTVVASMKTGRGSVKFGKGLLSALSMAGPVIYWPGGTATAAVLTPDAGRLFVVNVQTNDVTAIDTDGAKALDTLRVGTRPYEINITRGADALWIFSSEHATRLNPRTLAQADVDLTRSEGFTGWPLYDYARERILLPRETGIEILSAHDGSRSGMVEGLQHPVTVRSVVRLDVALADPAPAE